MKHIYNIEGMTCNGCRNQVEETLSKLEGVSGVSVDLEKETAVIVMNNHIETTTFQKKLPKKFTISDKKETDIFEKSSTNFTQKRGKSKLQQLKPLLLILFYIFAASILLHKKDWNVSEMMLDFMGLFYIVFSFFKLLDLKGFPQSFSMYDPLAKALPIYGWVYPFLETALGLMFLFRFEIPIALITTLVILGITTMGVTKTLLNKKAIQCACLGTALKLPMTEATFIENAIMIIMAIVMLINFLSYTLSICFIFF